MKNNCHTCSPHLLWRVSGVVITVAALLTLPFSGCAPKSDVPDVVASAAPPAEQARGAQGVDLEGLKSLLADSTGKVRVINFWATWCPPCVAEIPELAAFYKENKDKGVAFLAISLDSPDEIEKTVNPFLKEKNVTFPVHVLLKRDLDAVSEIIKQELAGVLPTTLVYDKTGNVIKMFEGAITKEKLDSIVKPLL